MNFEQKISMLAATGCALWQQYGVRNVILRPVSVRSSTIIILVPRSSSACCWMVCWVIRHGDGCRHRPAAGHRSVEHRPRLQASAQPGLQHASGCRTAAYRMYLPKRSRPACVGCAGGSWWGLVQRANAGRSRASPGVWRGPVMSRSMPLIGWRRRIGSGASRVRQALRWIRIPHRRRTHRRLGYSAGAHLVLMLGVLDGDDLYDPELRLRAIVAGGAPADCACIRGARWCRSS